MKITTKVSIYFLTLAIICAVISFSFLYYITKNNLEAAIELHLDSDLQSRARHIETYLELIKVSVKQLSKGPVIGTFLKMNKGEQEKNYDKVIKRMETIKEANTAIHDFLLLDISGKVVASTDKNSIGIDKSLDEFFINGRENTYIKDAYYQKDEGEQLLAVSTPMVDADTNKPLGILAARVELGGLNKIVTDRTGLLNTGEIYIVNKDGYMITPSRFVSETFLKQKIDTENFRTCISNKGKKCETPNVSPNYLGKMVLSSCEYVPEMDWVLIGEIDAGEAFKPLKNIQLVFIILLFIVPLVGFILGKIISEVISKPISKLQKGMEIIGKGHLDHKVGTTAQDEIGQLSRSFDRMTEKLKDSQERLIRSEKLAVAGKLSSSIAHDIRNPLSSIKVSVYKLKTFPECKHNPEIMGKLSDITYEIDVSDKVINNFLEFTRIKKPVLLRENINLIIKETLNGFQLNPDIELTLELQEDLPDTLLDKVQIREVFYNLIKNALEAMETGGKLKISTILKGDFIEIAFNDTGCGIPAENTGIIFEPLFSTKSNGNGLGLFISESLIEKHHGKIKVKSEAGKGTTFIIKLPFSPK